MAPTQDTNLIKLQLTMQRIIDSLRSGTRLNKPTKLKNPCSLCNKNVLDNQDAIQCDTCDKWCHIKCENISKEVYNSMNDPNKDWHCMFCQVKASHSRFPFTLVDTDDLLNINSSNSMKLCENLPSIEIVSESTRFSDITMNDVESNIPPYVVKQIPLGVRD